MRTCLYVYLHASVCRCIQECMCSCKHAVHTATCLSAWPSRISRCVQECMCACKHAVHTATCLSAWPFRISSSITRALSAHTTLSSSSRAYLMARRVAGCVEDEGCERVCVRVFPLCMHACVCACVQVVKMEPLKIRILHFLRLEELFDPAMRLLEGMTKSQSSVE